MKLIKTLSVAAAAASALLAVSCGSTRLTPEDVSPVAVISFSANPELRFYGYGSSLKGDADKAAKKVLGGGFLGKITGALVSTATDKAEREAYPYLYTDALVNDINVSQAVLDGISEFPEVLSLLSEDDVAATKDYAKIKSDSSPVVGGFKSLSDEKKIASAQKALAKAHGAKGFATVHVQFGYYLDENKTGLDKARNVLEAIGGEGQSQSQNGILHPAVTVIVTLQDKDGNGIEPGYYYRDGTKVKKDKEDKSKESFFQGSAVASEGVEITYGKYDGEEFYKLYTEDLVREAVRNAALRQ